MQLVRNLSSGEIGIIIKHCKKTVKVCIKHPTIKNCHVYKYWRFIESIN